jgi:hypothetical protein
MPVGERGRGVIGRLVLAFIFVKAFSREADAPKVRRNACRVW